MSTSSITTVITDAGFSLLRAAPGHKLIYTRAVCGSGYVEKTQLATQTEVTDYVMDLSIVEFGPTESAATLRLQLDNSKAPKEFQLYQIGISAKLLDEEQELIGETLIQIMQYEEPDIVRAVPHVSEFVVNVLLGQAEKVEGIIDMAAYVSLRHFSSRTVNGKPLSADVTLTGEDINVSDSDPTTVKAALSNKAPTGYGLGLGSGPTLSSLSALDNARSNGWYLLYLAGTGTDVCGYTYGTIRVDASSRGIHQTFHTAVDPAGVIHRVLSYESESWGPWEWENPLLVPGVEYQTTKRYGGKVVFQKLVSLGQAIDGAVIEVVSDDYRINKISHAKGDPGLFPICQWDIRPELSEWDFAIACDGRNIKIYAGSRATEGAGKSVNVLVEYYIA